MRGAREEMKQAILELMMLEEQQAQQERMIQPTAPTGLWMGDYEDFG